MSTDPDSIPVGRLAPSPTGLLHLGHARTFLLAWWHLRSRGGRVLLRIEDLDRQRSRPEYETALFEDLEWLGLDWDGPVERQSERRLGFDEALAKLASANLLYPCVCTRKELESAASAPHASDGTLAYPGTCQGRFASPQAAREESGREPALRFRCSADEFTFVDGLHGEQRSNPAALFGDFPVARRDGTPAYQLAVVVDDAKQGVTEVHRGDDLLSSTPCQLVLQRALGLAEPRWFHFSLVVDESGQRLAKRHDSLALRELRERGVSAQAVVGWIAESAGLRAPEGASASELAPHFDLARVPRSPVVFGPADLAQLAS